jgi:hypothetical protein
VVENPKLKLKTSIQMLSIQDKQGRKGIGVLSLSFGFLSHNFLNLKYKAVSWECCLLLDNAFDCLGT